ncbi:MAG: alpha/beta-hydrolase family protein [Candidatus Nanopelagicales bacterium]|jgi:uncharacterized membrane protein|nr:alpha/beta-hydrolase family protein [Candidatus Nanopelagicales bacterium]
MATSLRAGALAAGLTAPVGFEPSLLPRSAVQQGIVSGLSASATLGAVALGQALTRGVARSVAGRAGADPDVPLARAVANAGALCAGVAAQRVLHQVPDEPMVRAVGRTAGYELALGAGAALVVQGFGAAVSRGDLRTRTLVPGLLTVAAAAAAAPVVRRRRAARHLGADERADGPGMLPSLAAAAAVATGVQGLALVERGASHALGHGLAAVLPGPPPLWTWAGRMGVAAGSTALVVRALDQVYERIESGAEVAEPGLSMAPNDPYVSGGPTSLVPYATLSREGRRHVVSRTRTQFIERAMGQYAVAEPIRVFVGLESAPTIEARVALALDEIDRLGALDRSLLLLVSPTGTGYVNYAAVEAVEYLALGDVATVTMQYSLRPSFLSLDRVDVGRSQNTALWEALHRRVQARPADQRPRVLMFGESLGAHTSQDAVLHQGVEGLAALGVERALWIGTPFGSAWRTEVLGTGPVPRTSGPVGEFDSYEEYRALPDEVRSALRYVMITHAEDGVPRFGPPLAVQAPTWLLDEPRQQGIPAAMRWAPVTTFLQVFVDMLNGSDVTPGTFAALGHDYRADLLEFASAVYDLPATPEQLQRLARALPLFEHQLFDFIEGMQAVASTAAEAPGTPPRDAVPGRARVQPSA